MKTVSAKNNGGELTVRFQTLVGYRLRTVTGHLANAIERLLIERAGVSLFEWRIIAAIWETQCDGTEATASAIGPKVMLDKMQTSRTVNRLIESAFVKSIAHPKDGRASVLRLTKKGERAYRASLDIVSYAETLLFQPLTADERKQFQSTLDKLVEHTSSFAQHIETARTLPTRSKSR
jgi:DNA-binding MarR family transcriptional regulator